jgi:predicted RNase H-like nuclease (RuvC/YqgF family)
MSKNPAKLEASQSVEEIIQGSPFVISLIGENEKLKGEISRLYEELRNLDMPLEKVERFKVMLESNSRLSNSINSLSQVLKDRESEIRRLEKKIKGKDSHISQLETDIRKLNERITLGYMPNNI